jgi:hypothetical protein
MYEIIWKFGTEVSPVYFRPIRKSEAEDTLDDIAEALVVNYGLAEIIYSYMPPPPPKIQFWNDYPGRATLRSRDHKIYMLGVHGPVGPLGIADEKGSYSLSRKLIGPVSDAIMQFDHSLEPSSDSWMGIRETLILTELKDGKVTSREVAKHRDSKVDHFDHPKYREKWIRSKLEETSPNFQSCLDYTRADHHLISPADTVPTVLKDQKGNLVEDAEIVVAASWYVLTLTRNGDLYFNRHLYMKDVRSIARAETDRFVLILNKNHRHEFHHNKNLIPYLRIRNNFGGKENIKQLISHGENFGLRDSSLLVVGPAVYTENFQGHLGLRTDGRLESKHIPPELKTYLSDRSNYVKSAVSLPFYHVALLELGNGSQEVYIWADGTSIKVDFNRFYCFQTGNFKEGKLWRKRIVDITVSDNNHYRTGRYYDFMRDMYMHSKKVIALNFEDNSSCLLLFSDDRLSDENLSVLTSFYERTRSIHNTADGMLIVTDSRILLAEPGKAPYNIVHVYYYVSFVVSPDGYVIVHPNGKYIASESVQPPADIKNTILQGGGIAEIYHDRSGTFHVILRDGRIASWYSKTSVFFRNTPKWDIDKSFEMIAVEPR